MPQHRKPTPPPGQRQPGQPGQMGKPAIKPAATSHHPSFYPPSKPLTRRRSVAVTLGALGLVAAGFAAFSGKDVQRNSYNSLEDCEHDYATGQCTQDQPTGSTGTGGGGHSGGAHFYGPWYRSDWRNGPVRGDPGPGRNFASGSAFTGHGPTGFDFGTRGGFGSHGRISARGG